MVEKIRAKYTAQLQDCIELKVVRKRLHSAFWHYIEKHNFKVMGSSMEDARERATEGTEQLVATWCIANDLA